MIKLKVIRLPGLWYDRAVCSPTRLRLGCRRGVRSTAATLQLQSLVRPVLSAFVVRVERVPSSAVFSRSTVVSSSTTTWCTTGRIYLISLTSKLPKPAGERTRTASAADIWILPLFGILESNTGPGPAGEHGGRHYFFLFSNSPDMRLWRQNSVCYTHRN